ncbi:MAG: hypothetical protein HY879_20760 [Deltaproteobacteria bacterium]|nr:hypothetical protein [Deltaproteobacteria bacterium]
MIQTTQPRIKWMASSLLGKVPFEARWTGAPLPESRNGSMEPGNGPWTFGSYFQVIQDVISRNSFALLLQATGRQLASPVLLSEVTEILIYAEKHGNLYHPAKIEVITKERCARFVMNVALTERGRAAMLGEIRALTFLTREYPYPFLPIVYSCPLGDEGAPAGLFLAEWFEGFHEFHLSLDPAEGTRKLILWDGNQSPRYLTDRQRKQVYLEISKILTLYYNPLTFDQIFPWHHGAGDFVVKREGEKVEVRLVTVRQYGPMMEPSENTVEEALLFFFLNLSLRMRLDRLDGVGEIVWAEDDCLEMTWEGFQEALQIKEREGGLTAGFRKSFLKGLSRYSEGDLVERFSALLDAYDPAAPDLPVIRRHLSPHITQVYGSFN